MEARLKILLFFMFLVLNSVVAQPVPRLSSETEWRALLELRSSLGIRAKDWHKKANPCLNWTGIECKDGHVTGITLSGVRRTRDGKLNPRFSIDSLPNFPLLSTFNSSGFELAGQIPEWLGQRLSNLQVLDLRSSSIYGSIPSSLGGLSRLSSLFLSNNSITGNMPTALGKLFSISVLDLSQNSLTGQIPGEFSALGNLSRLDLSSNYLSGGIPVDFGSLSILKQLNLSYNSLSDFIPTQLGNLSQLIELDLGFNSFFGSLPKELGGLRSLRKMNVGNNQLEGSLLDGLFQELAQLEYLVLCENSFIGTLPDAIWSMSHLKHLDVSGNNLTGVFPKLIASVNITGAVFNFSNNLFYGNLSSGIGKVRVVDVSSNYFEGSAPNDTGIKIILTNNCFLSVSGQRNSEACLKFYSERGLLFGNDTGLEPLEPRLVQPSKSRKRLVYVMVGVFGGLGFIVVLITGVSLLLKACNGGSTNHQRENSNVRPVAGGIEPSNKVLIDLSNIGESFTYEQMLVATCNFSTENLIKQGHSGDLFCGTLEGGYSVVVKRVDLRSTGGESIMSELDLFGRVSHPRLVPLVGHCLEDEHEKFLVYKYMPNGDLSNAMYRLTNVEEDLQSLDWITRLKIAIGAAEALSYLHHECTPPVVHRDIEASSILLDDKYEVRLGSFGEVCAPGAHQSMIARFLRTPQTSGKRPSGSSSVTCAYDVYCFGKVLLELVTGRLGISRLNDADAKLWLESNLPHISIHEKEQVIKIVDQSLIIDEDLLEEVWAIAIVAKSCLNPKASRRPSMRHVLKALENPFKVVREENFNSGRLRMGSSRRYWTAAFFGSWHHSSSDSSNMSAQTNREIIGGLRQSERVGSRGSGVNDYSSSHKRSSSDVFPEPVEMPDVERQDGAS
ncbi:putative LRR receptor-like serine/threonine-protein kinase [Sesamum alatum]|uniref:LRR receptor-like serine/threonine-protein kinase n=1 Tax=Sesamum alatum TaxID=300844 RepID=A0AAE2CP15_9LAMI|nr:putative LRR receptor-like serine/threonine-protein kinase [Sesamum alatum]